MAAIIGFTPAFLGVGITGYLAAGFGLLETPVLIGVLSGTISGAITGFIFYKVFAHYYFIHGDISKYNERIKRKLTKRATPQILTQIPLININ